MPALIANGSCTTATNATVNLSIDGEAFEINPSTADLYGRVVHLNGSGDVAYSSLSGSTLSYDSTTGVSSLSLGWMVDMPVYGILLPLQATAN